MDAIIAPLDIFEHFRNVFILLCVIFGGQFVWKIYRLIANDAPRHEIVRIASDLAAILLFVGWMLYGSQLALVGGILCVATGFAIRFRQLRWS